MTLILWVKVTFCLPFLMMWRYMSKSASADKYLMSFIKLNLIYLSTAENNNFILISVKFKSLNFLSQSYQISSKSFLKPMALVFNIITISTVLQKTYNLPCLSSPGEQNMFYNMLVDQITPCL